MFFHPTMMRIETSLERGALVVRFGSESGLPRLTRDAMAEIGRQVALLVASKEITGCVLAGGKKAFAVGADIGEIRGLTAVEAHEFSRAGQNVMRAIADCRKPVLAAICGYCMGGGLDLALACRARVASCDAVFAHPGGALGILTGWGGTQRLARIVGKARAREMLLTGRRIGAAEALGWGLVEKVVQREDLLIAALRMLRGLR